MYNFLGVYIHIPFCTSICSYCDFAKVYYNKQYIANYLDNLEKEIQSRYQGEMVDSIYIGGGTPTSLDYEELEHLLNIIKIFKTKPNLEFTIESNIESLDEAKIKLLKKYNVNRVSLGVQSFNQKCLTILNRTHTKEQTIEVIEKLKTNGLTNINIDIIYGIINDKEVVKKDIETFLELDIPHISCYSLILEDNTLLAIEGYQNIDDNIEYQQYGIIRDLLTKYGYKHYEISNYAKDNFRSSHNLNYWNNGYYYGFGLAAVSFLNNYRITNTRNLTKYLNGHYLDNQILENKDQMMSNTMILGLRKLEGVNINLFYERYQEKIEDVFNIKELLKDKLILIDNNYLKINPQYLYLSNEILLNFLERSN